MRVKAKFSTDLLTAEPRPSLGVEGVAQLVREALAVRYLDALRPDWVPAIQPSVTPGQARLRRLREHPQMNIMFSSSRIERFWARDVGWLTLFATLMSRSPPVALAEEPLRIADLARISGLSPATVQAAIARGCHTGDFLKERAGADRRQLLLRPSAPLIEYGYRTTAESFAMGAEFCGRPAPDLARLQALAGPRFLRLGLALASSMGSQGGLGSLARRNTFFTLWDLLLAGDPAPPGFIRSQAHRLRVSSPTVRAVLEGARAQGWLEPGLEPRLTPLAVERLCACFSLAELRWNLLLDALDAVAAHPEWAPGLEP